MCMQGGVKQRSSGDCCRSNKRTAQRLTAAHDVPNALGLEGGQRLGEGLRRALKGGKHARKALVAQPETVDGHWVAVGVGALEYLLERRVHPRFVHNVPEQGGCAQGVIWLSHSTGVDRGELTISTARSVFSGVDVSSWRYTRLRSTLVAVPPDDGRDALSF